MPNQIALKTDQRFFNTVLNASLGIVLVGTVTSWLQNMPFHVLLVHFISIAILITLRVCVKKQPERYSFFVHSFLIFASTVVGLVYFFNAGIDGTIMYIYLAIIQAGFLITGRTKTYWFAFAVPIILGGIFLVEYLDPSLVAPYANDEVRHFDIVLSVYILVAMTTYFSISGNKWIAKEREENHSKAKELEAAHSQTLAALKTREDFLSVMSHEVRTPLNAVLGFSQLLKQTNLTKEQKELNQHIINGGEQLLDLMNQVLDYSRSQKNLNTGKLEKCDLIDTISQACTLHLPRISQKNLRCDIVFDLDLPAKLSLDRPRFLQILNNLISNSIKFTDEGGIRVSVRKGSGERLIFEVEDTGLGISEDHLQRIFEPFEQVDSSLSRNFDGAGLGLAVCKKNAEVMQGELSVQSKLNSGSVFTLSIPLLAKSKSIREVHRHPFGFNAYHVPHARPELTSICLWLDEFGCKRIEDAEQITANTVILRMDQEQAEGQELVYFSDKNNEHPSVQNVHLGMFLHDLKELSKGGQEAPIIPTPSGVLNLKKILVVDDNKLNRLVASKMLENLGISDPFLVANGEHALELCEKEEFDLVLMDIYMPGMNGFTVAERLVKAGFKGKIYALSAQEDIEENIRSEENHFSGFINKPLTLEALAAILS